MPTFLLREVDEVHHKKCQDECDIRTGAMLKCMNLKAIRDRPCKNVIHASCAGYDPSIVPHLSNYFCTDCTTANSSLHDQMSQIEEAAKEAAKKAQNSESISKEEFASLKAVTLKMESLLQQQVQLLNEQKKRADDFEAENRKLTQEIQRLKDSRQQQHVQFAVNEGASTSHSTFIDRLNETIQSIEATNEIVSVGRKSSKTNLSSSILNSTYNTSKTNTGWPNYEEQERQARAIDGHNLLIKRSSISQLEKFEGDVTEWPRFLSAFVRTSFIGHFSDCEDVDRLRGLIAGEPREIYGPELSEPGVSAISILQMLDDHYGTHGNSVSAAFRRVTQLSRMEKTSDREKLKRLYTTVKEYALQCRIFQLESELSATSGVLVVESKMPHEFVKSWRDWVDLHDHKADVNGIIAFLHDKIVHSESMQQRPKPPTTTNVNVAEVTSAVDDGGTKDKRPVPSTSQRHEARPAKRNKRNRYANCECFNCKELHPFYKCPRFIEANTKKRLEIVNRLRICPRCLSSNKHKLEDCPNKLLKCYVTGCEVKNRHPLMHGHPNEQVQALTKIVGHVDVRSMAATSHFGIVPGKVVAADGSQIPITIMFDGGSGVSLATTSLFERAKYDSHMNYELTIKWATEVTHTERNARLFNVKFIPEGKSKPIEIKDVTAVDNLKLPEQEQDARELKRVYPHLSQVPIPSYERQVPQILLGLTHAGLMSHMSSVTSVNEDDPVAALTPLGWIVYGNCHDTPRCLADNSIVLGFISNEVPSTDVSNDELLAYIRSSNDVESLGIAHKNASILSADDQRAESIIKSTMKFLPEKGRYEIGLLWRNPNDTMPDNYEHAVQRLMSTENRLRKLKMMEYVQNQFREQIEAGWLVEVTRGEVNKYPRRNYVYGFLTFNNNKSPPKPRWVNDTASTFKGVSLNSKLLKGPDTLVPLPQSMCALREGIIAYQGDVKSMFNQVLLKEEDQYSQLVLWRDGDTTATPRIYRQTRCIFGPACSPSDTSSVRIDHAEKCKEEFPEAADVALHQMYVDDAPDSRDTVEEAVKVARDLITMFARIGWPLVEFQSNSRELLEQLPTANVSAKMVNFEQSSEEFVTKVLGIFWKTKEDVFIYKMRDDELVKKCSQQTYMPTKKEMLSIVMRIFDPLGQISPFRIRGHMILQHVWRAGTDWNKRPPREICEEFKKWLSDFAIVAKLQIPRPYCQFPLKECQLELHVFVDAGSEAYAACAYIRIQYGDQVQVRLIAAKAKVAPVKYMSIPRLELMSGLIGARLLKAVQQWHRRLTFSDYTCWTDSEVSYKWIKSHHLPRTAFSAPRIAEIQDLTSADRWRYVPSKLNVADYATKERAMDYSDPQHEWLIGPKFLYENRENWPKSPESKTVPTIKAQVAVIEVPATQQAETSDRENESNQTAASNNEKIITSPSKSFDSKAGTGSNKLNTARSKGPEKVANDKSSRGILLGVSSKVRADWPVFVRVVAKALRFADYLLPQRPYLRRTGVLTIHELYRAENFIIREVQMAQYPEEYERLASNRKIRKASPIYMLSPVLCKQTKLIRVTTRLSTKFPLDMRSPPILPNFHEVTDSIVSHYHRMNLHIVDNTIIGHLRSRMWIVTARKAVRRARARCLKCIEKRTKPGSPDMADLPDFRLDIHQKPFYHTGCDLFGPFDVYTGRSKHKKEVHIVIFTCMVTRAVYFEVLDNKSTENFSVAFDKLWARRGPIAHMYSDNGLNFVGAARVIDADELQKQHEELKNATADKRITWHFNPPYTPQFGACWERLIKDTKRGLEASIGKFTVPRLSMEAALAKIEANLNNRPLTEVPVTSMEDTPITPQILMSGYPNYPCLDDGSNTEIAQPQDIMSLKVARRIRALVQTFRHRFIQEYAPVIIRGPVKSANAKYLLKLDDYVIYLDPTKNPSQWPRGIVVKTYPGRDQAVRVVDMKLKDGSILEKRPAHLIAKLDIRFEDPEAVSEKYKTTCKILVTEILKTSLSKTEQLKKKNKNAATLAKKIKSSQKMSRNIRYSFLDGVTFVSGPEIKRENNIQLNDAQKKEFMDETGEKTVYVKNLPASLGVADIFRIMSEFGVVKTIMCSSYNGIDTFTASVTYEDPACVSTAVYWNKSQLVITKGYAYRLCFEKIRNINKTLRSIRRPTYSILQMEMPMEANREVLLINLGQETPPDTRKPLPLLGDPAGGIICHCTPKNQFDFAKTAVKATNEPEITRTVRSLPQSVKPITSNEVSSAVVPSAHSAVNVVEAWSNASKFRSAREVLDENGNLIVTLPMDSFDGPSDTEQARQPDLREVINHRREIKKIKSVICRPKSRK